MRIGEHAYVHLDLVSGTASDVIGATVLVDGPGRRLVCSGSADVRVLGREAAGGPFQSLSGDGLDLSAHLEGEEVSVEIKVEALAVDGLARGSTRLRVAGPPVGLGWDQ